MRCFLTVSHLFFILQTSFCQLTIEGKVLDLKSKQPIPFANIGIVRFSVGTLSNEDGSFSLQVTEKMMTDSVKFSSLGFGVKSIAVQSLINSTNTIYLAEKTVMLKEVIIKEKKAKALTFRLGNTAQHGGNLQNDTAYAGRSIALLIENKDPKPGREFPLYLAKANLHILRNNLKSIRFRVRINEVDPNTGLPGEDMLEQSVITESTIKSGWVDFDLSALNILVSKPFFVTFEQLTTKRDRIAIANGYRKFLEEHPDQVEYDTVLVDGKKMVFQKLKRGGIDLPGTFIGMGTSDVVKKKFTSFARESSFAEWQKVRGIVTATVELTTHKK